MKLHSVPTLCLALSIVLSVVLQLPTFADKTPVSSSKDSAPAAATASDKTVPGWVLNVNSNFAGTVLFYITPDAVRMKFDKLGLLMLIKAPKWNALVYNESNKNYVDLPEEHWKAKFLLRSKRVTDKSIVVKPERTGKKQNILGIPCYQVIVKRVDPKVKKDLVIAETWIAQDIKTPKAFNAMMKTMLDIPVESGTPMRVMQMGKNTNKLVQVMDCYKVQKTNVKLSDFQPLTGYKKVKDEMAMMLDESDDAAAGDDEIDTIKPAPKTVTPAAPPKKSGGFFDMFHK